MTLQGFARSRIRRQDDDLGKGRVGKLGIIRKEEPRGALTTYTVTIFASGCCLSQSSTFAVASLVASILLPSGICTSTRTSGRSDVGKNCRFTAVMPMPASTKKNTTAPATENFLRTDQAITWRRRR